MVYPLSRLSTTAQLAKLLFRACIFDSRTHGSWVLVVKLQTHSSVKGKMTASHVEICNSVLAHLKKNCDKI